MFAMAMFTIGIYIVPLIERLDGLIKQIHVYGTLMKPLLEGVLHSYVNCGMNSLRENQCMPAL